VLLCEVQSTRCMMIDAIDELHGSYKNSRCLRDSSSIASDVAHFMPEASTMPGTVSAPSMRGSIPADSS